MKYTTVTFSFAGLALGRIGLIDRKLGSTRSRIEERALFYRQGSESVQVIRLSNLPPPSKISSILEEDQGQYYLDHH